MVRSVASVVGARRSTTPVATALSSPTRVRFGSLTLFSITSSRSPATVFLCGWRIRSPQPKRGYSMHLGKKNKEVVSEPVNLPPGVAQPTPQPEPVLGITIREPVDASKVEIEIEKVPIE